MDVVAGVDTSTQSTKVELRRVDDGAVVARGSAPHPVTTPPRSEQDPTAWWSAFERAHTVAGDVAGEHRLVGIAVGGQQHGMVVLDARGVVVRPAKLWNDTESADDAERLVVSLAGGAGAWAELVGSVPVAAFTVTKLAWLRRCEPASWARLARVLLPHDWMTHRLTGAFTTDRGDASGTGYWSPSLGEYVREVLDLVDPAVEWEAALPTVLGPLEPAGEWRGAIVGPGTGDNMATALGLGLAPGDAVVSIGTSVTAFAVSGSAVADSSGAVAGFADATGRYLPLVCTLNGTKVLESVRGLLGVDHAGFDALALAGPSGANGTVLLPYFDGERTPNLPGATGTITGLRSDVTREQFARAAVEGVVCGALDALDELRAHVAGVRRVLLVGGGARSAAVRAVMAQLCDVSVEVVDADEAAAAGACVQAAAVSTGEESAAIARRWGLGVGSVVEPLGGTGADRAEVRGAFAAVRALESARHR